MARRRESKVLGLEWFARGAAELAPELIGKVLVHHVGDSRYRARIVEAEAYVGPEDLAAHSSKGLTGRTKVLFGPPGHAYVYFIYGMYWMFNIVAGREGGGQAVLIRAGEPLDGWEADLSGPGKLARAMQITRKHNGQRLDGPELYVEEARGPSPRIRTTPRIGVDYSMHWKDAPLRFLDADSSAVSRPGG